MTGHNKSLRRRVLTLERALAPPIDAHGIHRAILADEPYPDAGDPRADRFAEAIKDMLERSSDIFPNRPSERLDGGDLDNPGLEQMALRIVPAR